MANLHALVTDLASSAMLKVNVNCALDRQMAAGTTVMPETHVMASVLSPGNDAAAAVLATTSVSVAPWKVE